MVKRKIYPKPGISSVFCVFHRISQKALKHPTRAEILQKIRGHFAVPSYKIYFNEINLRIHSRNNEFFKIFRNRYQIIIDHNIFRVNSVNMININNI